MASSGNSAIQDFYVSTATPTKRSSTKHDKQTQSLSPWRIRLTVQADSLDQSKGSNSRGRHRNNLQEQTIITTVPLKESEDSSPTATQRSRERHRRSNGTPAKRNGTPKPKQNRKRRSSELLTTAEDATMLTEALDSQEQIQQDPAIPLRVAKSYEIPKEGSRKVTPRGISVSRQSKCKNRRKEITPTKLSFDPNERSDLDPFGSESLMGAEDLSDTNIESSACNPIVEDSKCSEFYGGNTEASISLHNRSDQSMEDEKMWRSMIRRDSQEPQPSREVLEELESMDPTEEHHQYDSILESEGFSIISMSSLPSAGVHSGSPVEQDGGTQQRPEPKGEYNSDMLLPTSAPVVSGYSDISSIEQDHAPFEFTSPPTQRPSIRATPACSNSPVVPNAPTAPEPCTRDLECSGDGTPKLVRIVRAGNALQDAVETGPGKQTNDRSRVDENLSENEKMEAFTTQDKSITNSNSKGSEKDAGDPFSSYGGGTVRELRAGLRLGEELAKRPSMIPTPCDINAKSAENFAKARQIAEKLKSSHTPHLNGTESQALSIESESIYPKLPNEQLPSPARTLSSNDESVLHELNTDTLKQTHAPSSPPFIDQTMLAKEAEWQLEREAVSRQIQMANSSQVIVIDSDDSNLSSKADDNLTLESYSENEKQAVCQKHPSLPVSKTPSTETSRPQNSTNTEKRSADISMDSSSNLFWRPDETHVDATRKRRERRRQARESRIPKDDLVARPSLPQEWTSDSSVSSILSQLMVNSANQFTDTVQAKSAPNSPDKGDLETNEPITRHTSQESFTPKASPEPETSRLTPTNSSSGAPGPNKKKPKLTDSLIDPAILRLKEDELQQRTASPSPMTANPPSSWLGALARPLTSIFSTKTAARNSEPSAPAFPPATKSDILCSSKAEPLSAFGPWKLAHFHALEPLYYAAFLYGAFIFPYNPSSPSAKYLGMLVRTSLGWERQITETDCGVTDAFMVLLRERSQQQQQPQSSRRRVKSSNAAPIDEALVVRMCVQIWGEMVMRGDVDLSSKKLRERGGERAGKRREGDRTWTAADTHWEECQRPYHDRKKREWGGLPSWREKGLVWKG